MSCAGFSYRTNVRHSFIFLYNRFISTKKVYSISFDVPDGSDKVALIRHTIWTFTHCSSLDVQTHYSLHLIMRNDTYFHFCYATSSLDVWQFYNFSRGLYFKIEAQEPLKTLKNYKSITYLHKPHYLCPRQNWREKILWRVLARAGRRQNWPWNSCQGIK